MTQREATVYNLSGAWRTLSAREKVELQAANPEHFMMPVPVFKRRRPSRNKDHRRATCHPV